MKCPYCDTDSGTSVQCPSCGQSVVPTAPLRQQAGMPQSAQPAAHPQTDQDGSGNDPVEVLRAKLDIINNGAYPPHIAQMGISEKCKRAFSFYEAFKMTQSYGLLPQPPASLNPALKTGGYKIRKDFNKLALSQIWWAFFFGPFYYICTGMWRKGLSLLLLVGILGIVIEYACFLVTGDYLPRPVNTGLAVGFGYIMSVTAMYASTGQKYWARPSGGRAQKWSRGVGALRSPQPYVSVRHGRCIWPM